MDDDGPGSTSFVRVTGGNVCDPQAELARRRWVERRHRNEHAVTGYVWACALPELKFTTWTRIEFDVLCRPCLTAMVAAAVNRPNEQVRRQAPGQVAQVVRAPAAALTSVQRLLPENDPLRVRAEQVLVPLLAGA